MTVNRHLLHSVLGSCVTGERDDFLIFHTHKPTSDSVAQHLNKSIVIFNTQSNIALVLSKPIKDTVKTKNMTTHYPKTQSKHPQRCPITEYIDMSLQFKEWTTQIDKNDLKTIHINTIKLSFHDEVHTPFLLFACPTAFVSGMSTGYSTVTHFFFVPINPIRE